MVRTVAGGSADLTREWPLSHSARSFLPVGDEDLANLCHLTVSAWIRRVHAMEMMSRWVTGDLEADESVRVL